MLADIRAKVETLGAVCIDDLYKEAGIKICYDEKMNNKKMDSMLKIYDKGAIVFIKTNLNDQYIDFLKRHEFGHYDCHYEDNASYRFYLSRYKNKLEIEANTYACYMLLKDENLEEVNIIELLHRKGVPYQISIQFYDNLKNNNF